MSTLIKKHKYHKKNRIFYFTMILKDGFVIQETGTSYDQARIKGYSKFKFVLAYFKNHQEKKTHFIRDLYQLLSREYDNVDFYGNSVIKINNIEIYLLDEYILSVGKEKIQLIDLDPKEALRAIVEMI